MAKPNFTSLDEELTRDEQEIKNTANQGFVFKPKQFDDRQVKEDPSIVSINDLYLIPTEKLIPFRQKGDSDFSAWDEEELKTLAEQMDNDGAYEPIIVRKIEGENRYEILSGEHRVKASKMKGLKKVKSIVYRGCSDEKAMDIFLLTNLHRRTTKISDCIYGWTMFSKNHPDMRSIKETTSNTVREMFGTETLPVKMTQYYRYIKMSHLIKEFINALDNGLISIRVGCALATFEQEEQKMFIPFMKLLTDEKLSNLKKHLKETGENLTTDLIKDFIQTRRVDNYDSSLRYSLTKVKKVIQRKIKPEKYSELDNIMDKALDLFFEKYPDYKQITENCE